MTLTDSNDQFVIPTGWWRVRFGVYLRHVLHTDGTALIAHVPAVIREERGGRHVWSAYRADENVPAASFERAEDAFKFFDDLNENERGAVR